MTNNFEEIQKKMDLGIFPKSTYIKAEIHDLSKFDFQTISLNYFNSFDFEYFKSIFSIYSFQIVSIHNSTLDLEGVEINTRHLIIGDKVKVNLLERNFIGLDEITFLSVKTFKGKILESFIDVKKMILWYESSKSNNILKLFPNLIELQIYNGNLVNLFLTENQKLKKLQLHNLPKLEIVKKPDGLEELIVERCKMLKLVE
ncbi:hypothetical protein ASF10_19985 [Flavobacterium sp. Leaf82]|uniref:hypothetical protein n=1 Tax=Flavobacterium sp. Leaf82 TaxID=1736238 RepID=UPI0006F743AF|nr:hypothetical protein [Flavobacterium sp. Leaf82]KQO32740.1 hypothetical protein ASF10_19985 [Flavobacterium sp. Leaf82]